MDLNVSSPEDVEEIGEPQHGDKITHPSLKENDIDDRPPDHDPKLPPGWLDCPSMGAEIEGIIPSKVLIDGSFGHRIPADKIYSFDQVFSQLGDLANTIGLVIDLTSSSSYYSVKSWENYGIKHVEIKCGEPNSVPDNEAVNHFVYEVSNFFSPQKTKRQKTKKCFVHCTNGHNQTGFMIVHYLVRMLDLSVTEAIDQFAVARPSGIYKANFFEVLYNFYHVSKRQNLVCQTPRWISEADNEDSDVPMQENQNINQMMISGDVLGDGIPSEQQDTLRELCYQALKLKKEQQLNFEFPASHAVSLTRNNMRLLRDKYYYASWRPEGTRYMVLITSDGCYLIDSKFSFRRIQMRFPGVEDTLVDGEMIKVTGTNSQETRIFVISDAMMINKKSTVKLTFYERWSLIERKITGPRTRDQNYWHIRLDDTREDNQYRYDLEPFKIRRAEFWPFKLVRLFDQEDLIFQCLDSPYVAQTHDGLLRWKRSNFEVTEGIKDNIAADELMTEIGVVSRLKMYQTKWQELTRVKEPSHEMLAYINN